MVQRSIHFIVALAAVYVAGGESLGAQARERIAFVSVVDKKGAPKTDVTASDLAIREDGVQREILRVTPATGPMPIAVLVDTSAAAEPAILDIRLALTAFVRALGDTGPVSLIGFGDRPTIITDYTSTPATLAAGIGKVFARPLSGATVIDGVFESATGMTRRESERAAVVVLTVLAAEVSNYAYLHTLERLREAGAALHVVTLSTPGRGSRGMATRERDMLLDRGVRATGGTRVDVLATNAFADAMTRVAGTIAHQFKVVYARPESLIPPETFAVTATAPGFTAYGGVARGPQR